MKLRTSDINHLQTLEESLWKPETRFDESYMRSILTDDFFEFGRSGRIYTINDTLSAPKQDIDATLPLKNFAVHIIDENAVIVTYISQVQYDELEISNRSSIWIKTDDGWRLRFHQGTPAFDSELVT